MNNIIKLNSQIEIDLSKLIDSRLLVQANSGGGRWQQSQSGGTPTIPVNNTTKTNTPSMMDKINLAAKTKGTDNTIKNTWNSVLNWFK